MLVQRMVCQESRRRSGREKWCCHTWAMTKKATWKSTKKYVCVCLASHTSTLTGQMCMQLLEHCYVDTTVGCMHDDVGAKPASWLANARPIVSRAVSRQRHTVIIVSSPPPLRST